MPFCTNCGKPIKNGAFFCGYCGEKIIIPTAQPERGTSGGSGIIDDFGTNANIPVFTPPRNTVPSIQTVETGNDIPIFTPPRNPAPSIQTAETANDIPIFIPPGVAAGVGGNIPAFTPPNNNSQPNFNGPVCYHHPNEPAAGQCARCGKYVCRDCAEVYTVSSGEYLNKTLCYDCCQQLVAENVAALEEQKEKINRLYILTLIGMGIGFILGISSGSLSAALIFMLWIGSFWTWVKTAFLGWWNNPMGRSLAGFIGAAIVGLIIAPINTVKKIIQCRNHLERTSTFIEEDREALRQMREYMEYTLVMSNNKGIDLEDLMNQHSELYNNSYASAVMNQGEAAADAMLRRMTTRIASNGEIIRSFEI